MTEPAPAKINLWLHVTGRRPNGYHLLDSLVAFADVGDTVSVVPSPGGAPWRCTADGPFGAALPDDPADNLAVRAAQAFARAVGLDRPHSVHITKRLPVASGIGGGSADAAAALRGMMRLYPDRVPDPAVVAQMALELGADVPVCLAGRTAHMSGIGETLAPAPAVTGVPIVLVNPGVAVSTPAVFKARTGPFSVAPPPLSEAASRDAVMAAVQAARNDLEPPARSLVPAVAAVLEGLSDQPGLIVARMSGSGATCFGLFRTPEAAQAAAASVTAVSAEQGQEWWVANGTLL